jgi:hypothetical protein
MKKLVTTLAALAALSAAPARAQDRSVEVEIAPLVGAYLPILDQRSTLADAMLVGLAGTFDLTRNAALVLSAAWSPTQSAGATLDLFQWDIGMQGQLPVAVARSWTLKPFAGVGIGTRTYSFRDRDVNRQTDFAFYSSLGASLRHDRLVLGLTARHGLTAFGPAGDSGARGDVSLFGSVGFML